MKSEYVNSIIKKGSSYETFWGGVTRYAGNDFDVCPRFPQSILVGVVTQTLCDFILLLTYLSFEEKNGQFQKGNANTAPILRR